MTHLSRRVARAALIAAAGAAVPLIGAASAQASTALPLSNTLTGVSLPDAGAVTDQLPETGAVTGQLPGTGVATGQLPDTGPVTAAPAGKLDTVAPAANQAVGRTAESAAPQVADVVGTAGSPAGHAPSLDGLPLGG
jgi:hypothetical protein